MIKQASKLLYLGAGCHIEPVKHFPETKHFVFIDTQPRSQFDTYCPEFNRGFYRQNFLNDLIEMCNSYGFAMMSYDQLDTKYYKKISSNKGFFSSWFYKIPNDVNPAVIGFINVKTNQQITYYVSTNIKFNMTDQLRNSIATCDGVIVSGYLPETEILQYFITPKKFFGYTGTSYTIETENLTEEDNNIIYFLHNCICNTQYYFTEFHMIDNDSGVIVKCQDFSNFLDCVKEHNELRRREIIDNDTDIETD